MKDVNVYEAFNGQVIFETDPYITPMALITIERIHKAIPTTDFGEMEEIFFTDFTEFVSRTSAIRFNLTDDSPAELVRLKRFWDAASIFPRDYAALWSLFLHNYDTGAVRSEWDRAVQGAVPPDMAADPQLATALPDDEEALDNLPDDSPLSKRGKRSTRKSSKRSLASGKQDASVQP